jgi:hypothetical protein
MVIIPVVNIPAEAPPVQQHVSANKPVQADQPVWDYQPVSVSLAMPIILAMLIIPVKDMQRVTAVRPVLGN